MWSNPQFPANLVTFTNEILNGKLHFLCSVRRCLHETWNELRLKCKFRTVMKKNLFTLLFIAGEMRRNFVSGIVSVKRPGKYVNKSEWDIKANMLKATMQALIKEILCWINTTTNKHSKLLKIRQVTCVQCFLTNSSFSWVFLMNL